MMQQAPANKVIEVAGWFQQKDPAWACEKVASDLGLGGGFGQVLRFPALFTTG